MISAVGHETDVTLSDFVADRRAPTPSGAAEIAVPDQADFRRSLLEKQNRMTAAAIQTVRTRKKSVETLLRSPSLLVPRRLIERSMLAFDQWTDRLQKARPDAVLERNKDQFHALRQRLLQAMLLRHERESSKQSRLISMLEAYSPLAVLKQGYSIASQQSTPIASVDQLNKDQKLTVRFFDGEADCAIETIRKEPNPWIKT